MNHLIWKQESRLGRVCLLKWSEVAQPCPTLLDPMDCSLPGSSIRGIFQARVLEWGAISSHGKWALLYMLGLPEGFTSRLLPLYFLCCVLESYSLFSVLSQISLPSEVFSGLDAGGFPPASICGRYHRVLQQFDTDWYSLLFNVVFPSWGHHIAVVEWTSVV